MRVEVVPHNPAWRSDFEAESEKIANAVGETGVALHHIGSTAIPDIYAKPVIDFLIEVKDISQVDGRNSAMEALGYEAMGEYGLPGRRHFRKANSEEITTHNVHAFQAGSVEVQGHLAFRDYMISHPENANEYSQLKRKLAIEYPDDIEGYMDGKDRFIKQVEAKAIEWHTSQQGD